MYAATVGQRHQNGLGNARGCNEWNTCYEEKINVTGKTRSNMGSISAAKPTKLNDVQQKDIMRESTGIAELDRVLGGGLVKGSLILLGGEPGIRQIYVNTAIMRPCRGWRPRQPEACFIYIWRRISRTDKTKSRQVRNK